MDVLVRVESFPPQDRMRPAKRKDAASKPKDFVIPLEERPIDPTRLVVLAIGIVVAPLAAPEFVSGKKHRHASGDRDGQQKILDLPAAHGFNGRIVRLSLDAVVRAVVLIRSIPVALAVGFVVLSGVADQVVQRKTIVAGDEVDAALRPLT